VIGLFADRVEWPLRGTAGRLVAAALRTGCHVFLTEDRGILARAQQLFAWGIAAMRPAALLGELDAAGELSTGGPFADGLVPDLLSLARFYALPGAA
jgi:hypothetical protein